MCDMCNEMAELTMEQSRRADEKMRATGATVQELEQLRHRAAVHGLARAAEMGMTASPAFMALVQAWVRGELTSEEVARKILEMGAEGDKQEDREGLG